MENEIDDLLFSIYYDPKSPAGFSTCNRLYQFIRQNHNKNVSKAIITEWLRKQPTYTLHKNRRVRFKRNYYNITNMDDLWEMDLIDMQKFSRFNKGNRFILAVIDCFSKYAWCIPIKRKTPVEIINGFDQIFGSSLRRPVKIQSDKGREFCNHAVKKYFQQKNITFFTTRDPAIKAAICERFIRSIKGLVYKYLTFTKSKNYIDALESLTFLYNNRYHTTIGRKPCDVSEMNVLDVWNFMEKKRIKSCNIPRLCVGDVVRVSNPKTVFEKGYTPNWSEEKFSVVKVHRRKPVIYNIKDESDCIINGNFYESEVQKVD